jgi:hypothetical protein
MFNHRWRGSRGRRPLNRADWFRAKAMGVPERKKFVFLGCASPERTAQQWLGTNADLAASLKKGDVVGAQPHFFELLASVVHTAVVCYAAAGWPYGDTREGLQQWLDEELLDSGGKSPLPLEMMPRYGPKPLRE